MKKISVVMSMYNEEKYIKESVESILGQTYPYFEFIIIDDGSTDRSVDIVREYQKDDNRIILIAKPNSGIADSLNKGILISECDYIARMDADDISFPERLEKQLDFIENHDVDICYSFAEIIGDIPADEKKRFERLYACGVLTFETIFENNYGICNPSVLMKRDVFNRIGLYNVNSIVEDFELWIRALHGGCSFGSIGEKYVTVCKHIESVTNSRRLEVSNHFRGLKLREAFSYFKNKYKVWNQDIVRYAIWGAGNGGRIVKNHMDNICPGWELKYFIDTFKEGEFLNTKIIKTKQIDFNAVDFIFIALKEGRDEAVKMFEEKGLKLFEHFMCI